MTAATNLSIRPAIASDTGAIVELLKAAELPIEDLERAAGLQFWIATDGSRVVGVAGLERRGSAGLLRSLAVAPGLRQRGVGRSLVATVERESALAGLDRLVLLTQTAARFFRHAGYATTDRALVPEGIRQTEEFAALCPAAAVCMAKVIAAPHARDSRD